MDTTEDQMEMMMLMDKLPQFYCSCNDVAGHLSPEEFHAAGASNISNSHFNTDNPYSAGSPPIMNLQSTLSSNSNNTPLLDQSPRDFFPNPSSSSWRGLGELPDAKDYATPSQKKSSMAAMREMIFRIAAMQPIHIDPESVKPPKRRNVKISKDPQSVAARHRRERISERIRILQRLVPGGTKMDTASMLDEAIHYVKFLKNQVQSLEIAQANKPATTTGIGFPAAKTSESYHPMGKRSMRASFWDKKASWSSLEMIARKSDEMAGECIALNSTVEGDTRGIADDAAIIHEEAGLLERLEGVCTFGQPRVGEEQFGEYMIDEVKRYKVGYLDCLSMTKFSLKGIFGSASTTLAAIRRRLLRLVSYSGEVTKRSHSGHNNGYYNGLFAYSPNKTLFF
ncbi:hypothetical protein SADUNF_Sadunf02G0106100 [Salix dunnii]|uniref:BHLH domain-containing protein n=1 Tax=Salix dunnii TaxID=1413687 RepID=A0A835N7A2_9ROSI|nr:hypothetical protein SADUNF_Sadunf02G0106100 [Salix dunnii]